MRIGIITHHDVHNHGAQLQMFALTQVFIKLGHTCEILDYNKNYDFFDQKLTAKYNISIKSIPYYLQYLLDKGIKKTVFNINKRKLLRKFRQHNRLTGPFYSSAKNLDCVFIGSDEVFSIEPGLTTVFWGFGVPCNYIFSYAGCFGPTTIEFIKKHFAIQYIQAGINRLNEISVRDQNSKNIVEQLSDKNATLVCDPVLLYGFRKEIANCKKESSEKYLLVYSYDNNMNDRLEVEAIMSYATKKNLKIYSVGFYHPWADKNINVSPLEIFQYFKDAEKIVTDTFHGTILSIITRKEFVVYLRENKNKLEFLLKQYTLTNRILNDWNLLPIIFNDKIDYNSVDIILSGQRKCSLKFIMNCLDSVK